MINVDQDADSFAFRIKIYRREHYLEMTDTLRHANNSTTNRGASSDRS